MGTEIESHRFQHTKPGWRDMLSIVDSNSIQRDNIGNLTNDGTWSYTWQHGKQLAQITRLDGTQTIAFEYNEDGLRTRKTVTTVNSDSTTSTTVTEYALHGKNVAHLTQSTDNVVTDTLHFYYDAQGKPAIVIYNGTAYGYLYNLQGDVVALVDGTGTKVVEYTYDAWGKPTGKTGTMASTLGTVQPFCYRGYVWDQETGDYYLRSRYYRPEWCRFLSADALIKGNLYAYCYCSPVDSSDSNGLLPNGEIHAAVCRQIEINSHGTLYSTGNKVLGIPGKLYGLGDIRSIDGYLWEVKRVSCSVPKAVLQLESYLSGFSPYGYSELNNGKFNRGDNRDIHGVFDHAEYTVVYMNIGYGIILYDYTKRSESQMERDYLNSRITKRIKKYERASSKSLVQVFNMYSSEEKVSADVLSITTGIVLGFALYGGCTGGGLFFYKLEMD